MNRFRVLLLASLDLGANVANAQDPHATYDINSQVYGLFGYYVSQKDRPHLLAVFRPTPDQSQTPEPFDYEAACKAVLASPPVMDGVPAIEPTGVVVFFQVVQRRFLVMSTSVSSYTEFDVHDAGCSLAEPNSIYTPTPGFTPGISN
ncbi:MAG: hypothetical protein ABJF50_16195 [Paracoccaceae bacterium]|uniref:hypothetical protein n=1 Tax=Yoonia sp. TaxID=2212373 RepID=UPI003289105B